ncbi:MAG: type II secretion system protein GspJ [Syntrophorhabdaceae bacterium]|nr:type II secretion system protein GspJ [Syntrophorhabdaceae bacterium]
MISAAHRRSGFTLVEVLLTLAILAVILLLLFSAFTGAARTRAGLISRGQDFRQTIIAMERIGNDLQGTFTAPKRPETAMAYKEDTLSGSAASILTFTAFQLPSGAEGYPASSIARITYFPKVGRDGASIELHRRQSNLPFIQNRIPERETLIAEKLKGFRAEFYEGGVWIKEWPGGRRQTSLPKRVAIIIIDSRGMEYRREIPLRLAGQDTIIQSGNRPGSQ